MKLVTFALETALGPFARVGALQDGHVLDLGRAHERRLAGTGASPAAARSAANTVFGDVTGLIALGDWGLEQAELALGVDDDDLRQPADSVHLRPPLAPSAFRDCIAFEEHIRNTLGKNGGVPAAWYDQPVYYKGNPDSIIGPDDEMPWPSYSDHLDYELELGIVIGRGGRDLSSSEALSHVFGLTILNDFSARDMQAHEMTVGLGPAKGKDFASALGPWLVTFDELDIGDLTMRARVNGELWSEGNSGTIYWSVGEIVSHLSRSEPLRAGELIGTGTVGRGCGLELGRKLQPGDVVELEVTGLGVLRNVVGPRPVSAGPVPLRQLGVNT